MINQSKVEINVNYKTSKKLKPWINNFLCMKIKKRNHIFKLVKRHPENNNLKQYYIHFRNKLRNDIKLTKQNYYKQKFVQCGNDAKSTWNLINKLTKQSNGNDRNINLEINNKMEKNPVVIANEFNSFFLNIVDQLNLNTHLSSNFLELPLKNYFSTQFQVNSIFMEPVIPEELVLVIKSLKNKTTPGIDGISSFLIKEISPKIAKVLTYIVNFSFESGKFPAKLKEAVVIPVFKSGSKLQSNNYRPISLLSSFSKVFEKLMKKRLLGFLQNTNFFGDKQFGFRTGLNTENALINFMDDVNYGLNSGMCVSGLFLDIKKAFDTVNHDLLLKKLYQCGVRGSVHEWFKSYLSERKQCVRINTLYSDMGLIKHGVPQGSVLGAVLFIIYINDLCSARLQGNITSFADDTALCYKGKNWEQIKISMINDLKAMQWWFTSNYMLLSAEKTKFINFSLKNKANGEVFESVSYTCADCISDNKQCLTNKCTYIHKTNEIKYLGVHLDSEVNWKFHINKLKNKINCTLRYFYYLRYLCNSQTMRTLYFSLVQSRLEYGIVLWGSAYNSYLNPINIQQKHIVRIISDKNKYEHTKLLFIQLKILPLKYLYVYKVSKLFFIRSGNITVNTLSYRKKLRNHDNVQIPRPNNAFFCRTFNFIAPRIFNQLPISIKSSKTLYIFQIKLKKWLLHLDNIETLFFIQK